MLEDTKYFKCRDKNLNPNCSWSSVTLDKLIHLSKPQFPYVKDENKDSTCLMEVLVELNETRRKCLGPEYSSQWV